MKTTRAKFLMLALLLLSTLQLSAFYDPNLQRWPNRDPLGEDGGHNLYGYLRNSPVDAIDPFGEAEVDNPAPPFGGNTTASDPRSVGGIMGGNNPVSFPPSRIQHPKCKVLGERRNISTNYDAGSCPCSQVRIRCFSFEQCEPYDTGAMGLNGSIFANGWIKHVVCTKCPEGNY